MQTKIALIACLAAFCATAREQTSTPTNPAPADITVREVHYVATLGEHEARLTLHLDAEYGDKRGGSLQVLEGDVAFVPSRLPSQLSVVRDGNRFSLVASHDGRFQCELDFVARIQRAEPWNQLSFTGPTAVIASVTAQAGGAGMDVQLLSGTVVETTQTNGLARVHGLLGAERNVAFRWQGKIAEITRKALLTADTTVTAQITPTVIKYSTVLRYDIFSGEASRLTLALPAAHALTRLVGDQKIRDWQTRSEGDRQVLTVEFIKPVTKHTELTLHSEQMLESATTTARLEPPLPLDVERETGSLTVSAEDMVAETENLTGLRQVNAPEGAFAAYRFSSRPFTLAFRLKRVEPVLTTFDRVATRLEETRLLIAHHLTLNVDKAGVYVVDLWPQPELAVADVLGEGVEDWRVSDDPATGQKVLRVSFASRVLGTRKIEAQLEQALKTFPEQLTVLPLRLAGATKETAQIGGTSAAGIRIKTGDLSGLREVPVNRLVQRTDELLAYTADQPDWKLTLVSERLPARVVADVFNLVTIGDGLVGGSATIRFGIVNQGVQEFRVRLPAHCRNVEFTGPNIRRRELSGDTWVIGLQDKAWGGYTLVVTYDYQFDPKGTTLPVGGVHAVDVERETGSIAITTAASLKLSARAAGDPLRHVDESELAAADRALITRAVVLAYLYTDDQYDLTVDVKRHEPLEVLEAVADRTQITSVLTEAGEMLTQASFMVKNNAKQFQRFRLPAGSDFWGCYVNGEAVKTERDGDWVLVPLPREMNRDQGFAVDIMYAKTNAALNARWSQPIQFAAPVTDVPNTYAEWQLYVPVTKRLSHFGGTMNVAQGTTYSALDAWRKFVAFYVAVLREAGHAILAIGGLSFLVLVLVVSAARRGWSGLLTVLGVLTICFILAGMLLPALSRAKQKAQRINTVSNLKQVGLAARIFAGDNNDRLPVSFEEMMNELNTDKVTYDVETGQRLIYLGAGLPLESLTPDSVLAYSPVFEGHCNVLFADGSVAQLSASRFAELTKRGLIQRLPSSEMVQLQQDNAVRAAQLPPPQTAATLVASQPAPGVVPVPKPRGLRSIRIELPRDGNAFVFTKVLNVRDEPLSIAARLMPLETYRNLQMTGQLIAFLLGLGAWWWQWRGRRNTFLLTCALALVLGSVSSLLVEWRALHDALILGFPALMLAVVSWLIWRAMGRHRSVEAPLPAPPLPSTGSGLPPAIATAALALGLFVTEVRAEKKPDGSPQPESQTASVSILNAHYTGTVNDRVGQIEAVLQLAAVRSYETLPLFGQDVAVQEFAVRRGDAKLVRTGGVLAVELGKRKDVTLTVKLVARVGGDVTKRRLTFAIPPALTSRVALTLDQPDADVDFPTAVSTQRTTDENKTRVQAILGAGDHIELLWTPRVKRAAEVAATVFANHSALATVGGGVVSIRSVLDYQVAQGELRQLRIRLPAEYHLLRVDGNSIRTWETRSADATATTASSVSEGGGTTSAGAIAAPVQALPVQGHSGQVLIVELLKGVSANYRLTLELERALEGLPASVRIETPHALDVKRESGLIGLRGAEEVALSMESPRSVSLSELQRVDAEEFERAGAFSSVSLSELFSAFRFLKPDFELRVRAETVQPQVEAVVRHRARVAADLVSVSTTADYTIKRAGVFHLRLALPPEYRVDQVIGTNVAQWSVRESEGTTSAGQSLLEVALQQRTSGAYTLQVELSRPFKELPGALAIVGVQPRDVAKLTGFVSVVAEPGVAVKTGSFDGLTEIPAVSLPDGPALAATGGVLAFKFIATDLQTIEPWTLTVLPAAVEAWVRAEIVNTLTLTETLVSGRALVRYDIASAPVKALCLRIPAAFRNVEISGLNIRQRSQEGDIWCVELQNRTRGFYTLNVTWELPRDAKTNRVELAGVSADGVERETGLLAIVARPPLQVVEAGAGTTSAGLLTRVDTRELPDWAGRPDEHTVLAYRYVRPGYQLVVGARRFEEAQVLQALLDTARFTTVVAEDGQMMTEMSLSVRNNGRQFLEIELPPGAEVWSAFVAGQPVRPSRREGRLLLPLQEWGTDDDAVAVDLTYVGTNAFPRMRGQVAFVSPKFDVPLKNAQWELYLPPDYAYDDFAGTMTREVAAKPSLLSFGLSEYLAMEKKGKAAYQAEVQRDVSKAQSNLTSGNVRQAVQDYNRARGNRFAGRDEADKVQRLEQQLRSTQAENLINAQQSFALNNSAVPAAQRPEQQTQIVRAGTLYDNATAEAQWTKLAQAQEVAAAQVQPLHVNLPLRGLRYSFSQVLQTEINKPLTVQFSAASTQSGNWLKRIGLGLVGFVGLWAVVAVVAARKRS